MKKITLIVLLLALVGFSCKLEELNLITPCATPPVASFTIDRDTCAPPCTVTFSNASIAAASYVWDFGDGQVSNQAVPPPRIYGTAQNYQISLIAVGASGCRDTFSRPLVVYVNAVQPSADFSVQTGMEFYEDCPVVFTNLSSNATSFEWTFGDGSTSTEISPSHTYSTPNTYTVTLNAQNAFGNSTKQISITIKVVKKFRKEYIVGLNWTNGYRIFPLSSGSYILGGTYTDNGSIACPDIKNYIAKIDANGNNFSSKKFTTDVSCGFDINYAINANFLAATFNWNTEMYSYFSFDENLNVLGPSQNLSALPLPHGGGYYSLDNSSSTTTFTIKIYNSLWQLISNNSFSLPYSGTSYYIFVGKNNEVYCAGLKSTGNPSPNNLRMYVSTFSANGGPPSKTTEFEFGDGNEAPYGIVKTNAGIIVSCANQHPQQGLLQPKTILLDNNLNIINTINNDVGSIIWTMDDGFAQVGSITQTTTKYNNTLSAEWSKPIKGVEIKQMPDGGFIIIGTSSNNKCEVYKTDKLGNYQ